jgi:hypothetical protein
MLKKFIGIIAALAVAAPLVMPAVASANATTRAVARQFSRQVHNRASLRGIRVYGTSLSCRADGGGYYNCVGTYTGSLGKYGIYVDITPYNWHTVGSWWRIG